MGQDGLKEGPSETKNVQVSPKVSQDGSKWGPTWARKGQGEAKLAPKVSHEEWVPKWNDFGAYFQLLFRAPAVIRCLFRAVIFGTLLGALSGIVGRLKLGTPCGMFVKVLASDYTKNTRKRTRK